MSPAASAEPDPVPDPEPVPLRIQYSAELDQLRLQVEVMGVRVDENLERTRELLETGAQPLAEAALRADDEIDAMNVSLTERCYQVLAQENPIASDLRLVVSVVRVIGELERIGDLALRVIKLWGDLPMMRRRARSYDILQVMASQATEQYRTALRAWATQDLRLASELATNRRSMGMVNEQLLGSLMSDGGPDAIACALSFMTAGQAFDRIADHAALIGVRVRYLITADPAHLAAEVR